jgi:hypothetical protein
MVCLADSDRAGVGLNFFELFPVKQRVPSRRRHDFCSMAPKTSDTGPKQPFPSRSYPVPT